MEGGISQETGRTWHSAARFIAASAFVQERLYCNQRATIRDLYYSDTKLFPSQSICNDTIHQMEAKLECERGELGLAASPKGLVRGNFLMRNGNGNDEWIDASFPLGISLPICYSTTFEIRFIPVPGLPTPTNILQPFILVIEKEAIFQHIIQGDYFTKAYPQCILLTGRGNPDRASRQLLQSILAAAAPAEIPVFGLVDCNPWGYQIAAVWNASLKEKDMTIIPPQRESPTSWPGGSLQLLGLCPQDTDQIPMHWQKPLTKEDKSILPHLYRTCPQWEAPLREMEERNTKLELEALYTEHVHYLSECYLPQKLQEHGIYPMDRNRVQTEREKPDHLTTSPKRRQ